MGFGLILDFSTNREAFVRAYWKAPNPGLIRARFAIPGRLRTKILKVLNVFGDL